MSPKRRHEDDLNDDEESMEEEDDVEDEDEEEEDDEEETIGLDDAEDEEEDEDEDEDEKEEGADTSDKDRKKLFQAEAEDFLENLTLDEVKEVLEENEMDEALAPRLKKLLIEVINEGDVDDLDDAWDVPWSASTNRMPKPGTPAANAKTPGRKVILIIKTNRSVLGSGFDFIRGLGFSWRLSGFVPFGPLGQRIRDNTNLP